jgi:ribonuclease HI
MGVWASLTLAHRLSISDFHVLGDSKIVIDWLNRKGTLQVVTIDCWKDRINELIKYFMNISFSHVYREENQEANNLSKHALTMCPGNIAYNQWEGGHEGPKLFLKMY